MNMPKVFKISLFFFAFILLACSKPEENVPLEGSANFETLVISSDSPDNFLVINETVTFSVTGDDGVDYTNEAVFYVNQTEISGATYAFNGEGSYSVYASYLGVNSNTLDFEVIGASERVVLIDNTKALRNQTVTFSMVDSEGNDATSEATFYVNDTAITGKTYATATTGTYSVYARYEIAGSTFDTENKSFEIFVPVRKVVIEDYTGTWCGFCPSVAAAIIDAHAQTDDISVVAIHETANSNPDPFHFPQVQLLKDAFGVTGLPAARINRTTNWNNPYEVSDVTALAGEPTNLSIAIRSQVSGSSLSADVRVLYEEGSQPGDKLVLYLVENGLIYQQTNYYDTDPTSPYYNMGNPIPDFEHNEVLRLSLTDIFGDEISSTPAFGAYSASFTISLPSDYVVENLELVAMVVSADNTARNSQHAPVNSDKGYE